jgi:Rod binding domain-containing protein
MPDAITSLTAPQLPAPDAPKPKNAAEAARQFEAMLIAQLLQNARGSSVSGDEEDSTAATMWDLAAQQFSQLLAEKGGFGLATLITRGLETDKRPASPVKQQP